ncbi:MAG TPA: PEGA domain-containing protein [Edaphobacter sp.]
MDGTAVKLRLSENVSSADAKEGQQVLFEVIEEVSVQGTVVIAKGAQALATVTEAQAKRRMGRGGKLNVNIDSVRLVDGEKCQLRAVKDNKGGGHVGAMTGAMVATTIVFFPAAPLFLFMKGKDITIPKGTEVTSFVQGDMKLDMAKFGVPASVAAASANTTAHVQVESNVAGADIEVDGSFVGNTPSSVEVTPGMHSIEVKKKGYQSWTRKMNVSGSGAKITAELEQQPAGTN